MNSETADAFIKSLRYRDEEVYEFTSGTHFTQAPALRRLSHDLAFIAREIPPELQLRTLDLWPRPYVFERNPDRWNSERYFLVGRGYRHIGFPPVSFTRAELVALGFEHWYRCSAVDEAFDLEYMFPALVDSVKFHRRSWLLPLAALLQRAADFVSGAQGGAR